MGRGVGGCGYSLRRSGGSEIREAEGMAMRRGSLWGGERREARSGCAMKKHYNYT